MLSTKRLVLVNLLALLVLASCATATTDGQSDEQVAELASPVILDFMLPAGEIEIGELAVIVLDDPTKWVVKNNSPDVVELQDATDDGTTQTNFAAIGLKLGTANLYAEKAGIGQAFTIEVVAKKEQQTLRIADSDFSIVLPAFLAQRIEFVIQMDEYAAELNARNASYIYYKTESGEQRFGSFAWVLPVATWESIQNPNEPPLGEEMFRVNNQVLVVAGPQDLPFNNRYSNDATRYIALATLLDKPETYRYTP